MSENSTPPPFLSVLVQDLTSAPTLTGLSVGYERGLWRASQFTDHIMEWLPEFALRQSELTGLTSGNCVRIVKQAAKRIYETNKFQSRGEFGELILHAALRQVFGSVPAISKIFYKSSHNDTVKGFDAVHVVDGENGLELWLGEAKFYRDIDQAVREVVDELFEHTELDYLKSEFLLLAGKIDEGWAHAEKLKKLLDCNTSLDDVFQRACIPVLLTYESDCVQSSTKVDEVYKQAFEKELTKHHKKFNKRASSLPKDIVIHLILLPLKSKVELVKMLDEKLRNWQEL